MQRVCEKLGGEYRSTQHLSRRAVKIESEEYRLRDINAAFKSAKLAHQSLCRQILSALRTQ